MDLQILATHGPWVALAVAGISGLGVIASKLIDKGFSFNLSFKVGPKP